MAHDVVRLFKRVWFAYGYKVGVFGKCLGITLDVSVKPRLRFRAGSRKGVEWWWQKEEVERMKWGEKMQQGVNINLDIHYEYSPFTPESQTAYFVRQSIERYWWVTYHFWPQLPNKLRHGSNSLIFHLNILMTQTWLYFVTVTTKKNNKSLYQ